MLTLSSLFLHCTALVHFISLLSLYSLHISNNEEQRPPGILQCNKPNNQVRQKSYFICEYSQEHINLKFYLQIIFQRKRFPFLLMVQLTILCQKKWFWWNFRIHQLYQQHVLLYFPAVQWKHGRPTGMSLERADWKEQTDGKWEPFTINLDCSTSRSMLWNQVW